ncbi:hypothetical protein NLX83_23735 [Allokutzneria sp. A3M-2-11 16]|uniref:hypothetical protein n=1 Tax=Allokutzneria sp. A3M-2-11 16 TaxID=2962043 RepID=UPI0020B8FD60|nr:hypothetical protein [Allokutzneria sp. A3M-2-11 16]MCP3802286.1 hypothetical protein [Allokutzneria sp. A3M-2-11 16]
MLSINSTVATIDVRGVPRSVKPIGSTDMGRHLDIGDADGLDISPTAPVTGHPRPG